jgi:hypothetical protein
MSVDQLRLAESAIQAGLVLGVTTLPTAWSLLDGGLATILAVMWLLLASGVYSLHAVTFDSFRITGQRAERNFASTKGED